MVVSKDCISSFYLGENKKKIVLNRSFFIKDESLLSLLSILTRQYMLARHANKTTKLISIIETKVGKFSR